MKHDHMALVRLSVKSRRGEGKPKRKAISRQELARSCLEEIRLWPGCEGVVSVGVLAATPDRFLVRVAEYGEAQTRTADRALRVIERVKLRDYFLDIG
jgi:hypothetical protein